MKRMLLSMAITMMILSLSACGVKPTGKDTPTGSETSTSAQQENGNYTELADKVRLYKRSPVSAACRIQIKDEANTVLLDASDIMLVSAKWSEQNGYYIQLDFTTEGSVAFANATRENIGKKLSIVLDDRVLMAPVIVSEITDGSVIIPGYNDYDALISFFDMLI